MFEVLVWLETWKILQIGPDPLSFYMLTSLRQIIYWLLYQFVPNWEFLSLSLYNYTKCLYGTNWKPTAESVQIFWIFTANFCIWKHKLYYSYTNNLNIRIQNLWMFTAKICIWLQWFEYSGNTFVSVELNLLAFGFYMF